MAFDNLPQAFIPSWLAELSPSTMMKNRLPLKLLLEGSLYYPACGIDGDPVKYLGGAVLSFVYIDYFYTHDEWIREIKNRGFKGYRLLATRPVSEAELSPDGWPAPIPHLYLKSETRRPLKVKDLFCEWSAFERSVDAGPDHGPRRFSLLYVRAEGVAAFRSLYVENNSRPAVIAVVQPGNGFGRNWTDFRNEKAILVRTVVRNPAGTPHFLLYGGYGSRGDYNTPCWSQFSRSRGFIRIPENECRSGRRIGLWSK